MFAYCNNNPILYRDVEGESLTLAAAIGGAIAGAMISLTSYLVNCGITGSEVTADGIALALIAGVICGVCGAEAGAAVSTALMTETYAKAMWSAAAALISAIYAEVTGGNAFLAGTFTWLGAFGGALINTGNLTGYLEGFANFAVGLFTGTPAEVASTASQTIASNNTGNTDKGPNNTNPTRSTNTANRGPYTSRGGGRGFSGAVCAYAHW